MCVYYTNKSCFLSFFYYFETIDTYAMLCYCLFQKDLKFDSFLFKFSDFKTYFICGRVAPDINPIKTRPEGPNPVTKTSTFILQTDLINEANQVLFY